METDIIVIGAGAAGMIAMMDLLEAGYQVCLVEAAPSAGGRIATTNEEGFDQPVETGAEFIHGTLPITLSLLKKAGIPFDPVGGKMITIHKGKSLQEVDHQRLDEHWKLFMYRLGKLKKDMSIRGFLEKNFPGAEYSALRKSVRGFAEGFDLADLKKASVLAIRKEWSKEFDTQYRVRGGYSRLIEFLVAACRRAKGEIHYNSCVQKIEYTKGPVTVYTKDKRRFKARRVIITVSGGVLQSGDIEFVPALADHAQALRQIGFGSVIKWLLQFRDPFWKNHFNHLGFLLSDEEIPTWWTQLPSDSALLTGWLGGPRAIARSAEPVESLLQLALQSLSSAFDVPVEVCSRELLHHKIICWNRNPFIKGGYCYSTPRSAETVQLFSQPLLDRVFFAGEAFSQSESQGTVEAALESGRTVARRIIDQLTL